MAPTIPTTDRENLQVWLRHYRVRRAVLVLVMETALVQRLLIVYCSLNEDEVLLEASW